MKRFTVVNEGYNMEEVNRFIDIVIKRLEKLNNENFKGHEFATFENLAGKIVLYVTTKMD